MEIEPYAPKSPEPMSLGTNPVAKAKEREND